MFLSGARGGNSFTPPGEVRVGQHRNSAFLPVTKELKFPPFFKKSFPVAQDRGRHLLTHLPAGEAQALQVGGRSRLLASLQPGGGAAEPPSPPSPPSPGPPQPPAARAARSLRPVSSGRPSPRRRGSPLARGGNGAPPGPAPSARGPAEERPRRGLGAARGAGRRPSPAALPSVLRGRGRFPHLARPRPAASRTDAAAPPPLAEPRETEGRAERAAAGHAGKCGPDAPRGHVLPARRRRGGRRGLRLPSALSVCFCSKKKPRTPPPRSSRTHARTHSARPRQTRARPGTGGEAARASPASAASAPRQRGKAGRAVTPDPRLCGAAAFLSDRGAAGPDAAGRESRPSPAASPAAAAALGPSAPRPLGPSAPQRLSRPRPSPAAATRRPPPPRPPQPPRPRAAAPARPARTARVEPPPPPPGRRRRRRMKDKQKRKKERTWAEAARLVLENYSDAPMTPKQILQVIEAEGLKEMRSGTSPLACLNAMLHSNSRGEGLFFKLPGRISLFTLKKDALQWSRHPTTVEGEEPEDTADVESCGSNEASTVSGENDVSLDETSSNASCATESQSRPLSNPRDSCRTSSQTNKQKKKTGVMLPRVVLTPLKVNGAHVESASGFSGRHADGESGSPSSSSSGSLAPGSAVIRGQAEVARDPAPILRGFRKPTTGQMKRNRGEEIDFETPGSILVNTNLRALINSRTFHLLPPHFQQQLLFLLPEVDRQVGTDGLSRLSGSALNNEFFTHAAQRWRERLADGEFTHEMQVRMRQEMEKEKKVEQWKEKFFEDYYGQKLGLTKEESLSQEKAAEIKSVPGDAVRPQRGPTTRQRDGHFKKRSRPDLRTRARRNLCKKQEAEQADVTKDTQSVAADIPLSKDGEAKPDSVGVSGLHLPSTSSAASDPEAPGCSTKPVAPQVRADREEPARSSASPDRIPSLPQESVEQEPKDQKRKSFEQAASASFPEKKPRLEERQSFRNTIESVHPEKPQPTKEEPKVPPIRIQLSRIKPPWVVKGQPTYQICPRIVPLTESSCRGWTSARTLADIKARALQIRGARGHHCHREAATAAIGGGGGPGGGDGGTTDEGGGRGNNGGDGGETRGHPEPGGGPGASGECASDLQRTQLLPPYPLSEEQAQTGAAASSTRSEDQILLRKEASHPLQRVPGTLTNGLGDASQPPAVLTGEQPCQALSPLSSKAPAPEDVVEQPPLPPDVRTGCQSGATSWEKDGKHGPTVPPEESPVRSLVGSAVLEGGAGQALNGDHPPDVKESVSVAPVPTPEPSLTGYLQDRQSDDESELGDSCPPLMESAARQENLKGAALVSASTAPRMSGLSEGKVELQPELNSGENSPSVEPQLGEELEKAAPLTPASPGGLACEETGDPPGNFPSLWTVPSPGCPGSSGSDCQPGEAERPKASGDSAALSESTDTASDCEGQLSEDGSDSDSADASAAQAPSGADGARETDRDPSAALSKANHDDPSLGSRTAAVLAPQSWVSRVCAGPQRIPDSLLLASTEHQPRPVHLGRPRSSVEASNPLVMRLLQDSLPLEKVLLPARSSSSKPTPTPPPLPPVREQSSGRRPLQDPRESNCAVSRNSLSSSRVFKEPEQHEANTGLPQRETTRKMSQIPPCVEALCPVTGPAATSGKLEVDSKAHFSQKEACDLSQGGNSNAARGRSPGNLTTSRAPRLSSPDVVSLGPEQAGEALCDQNGVGGQGKKLLTSRKVAAALQCPRPVEPVPLPSDPPPSSVPRKLGLNKNPVSEGVQATREDWVPKPPPPPPPAPASVSAIKSEKTFVGGILKADAENRNTAGPGARELVDHLPFVLDLPFWKLPREPGKGLSQPLEPLSIPSQLNIKQAFYGKLSKLQLSSTSFNYPSSPPTFPRGLAGSVVQLSHKARFGASHSASLSLQVFTDSSAVESISLQCACSLKAMIMCQGCGAFCHDDCIGPSKLCVLCLVVR